MKTTILGMTAVFVALFATVASTAMNVCGTGCCPFCK